MKRALLALPNGMRLTTGGSVEPRFTWSLAFHGRARIQMQDVFSGLRLYSARLGNLALSTVNTYPNVLTSGGRRLRSGAITLPAVTITTSFGAGPSA